MATEKRLIDKMRIDFDEVDISECTDVDDIIWEVEKLIDAQPVVDAVEVVRCKDCKYFVQGEPYDPCECMKWMVKFGVAYTTPDGYCHKAERKDNG